MTDIPAPTQLGTIYTAKEAAARLRMTRHGVITIGRKYGCCAMHRRLVLFSEQDLLDIWQIMRAPATATKRATASAIAFYTSDATYKDLLRTEQRKREERARARQERQIKEREARRQRDAQEREARLAEKRQVSIAKREAREAKKRERTERQTTILASLDRKNRDREYWTEERKLALRKERVERMNQWGARPDG